jgi:hypothetical protein
MAFHDARIRRTLRHVNTLWSQRDGLWSDGAPSGHLTVRGAYAVALLYQELRRGILALDPLDLANTLDAGGASATEPTPAVELLGPGVIVVTSNLGSTFHVEVEPAVYAMVDAFIRERGKPVELKHLCKSLDVKLPKLRELIRRLNVEVWHQTSGAVGKLVDRVGETGLYIIHPKAAEPTEPEPA